MHHAMPRTVAMCVLSLLLAGSVVSAQPDSATIELGKEVMSKVSAMMALSSYAIQLTKCVEATVDGLAEFNLVYGMALASGNTDSGSINWYGVLSDPAFVQATKMVKPTTQLYVDTLADISAARLRLRKVMTGNMELSNLTSETPLSKANIDAIVTKLTKGQVSTLVSLFKQLAAIKTKIDTRLASLNMAAKDASDRSSVEISIGDLGSFYVSTTCMDMKTFLCGDSLIGRVGEKGTQLTYSSYETYYGGHYSKFGASFLSIVDKAIGGTAFDHDWSDVYDVSECQFSNQVLADFGGNFVGLVDGAFRDANPVSDIIIGY